MGEAKIFLSPCKTNVLHPVIRIEITDSGNIKASQERVWNKFVNRRRIFVRIQSLPRT